MFKPFLFRLFYPWYFLYCKDKYFIGKIEIHKNTHLLLYNSSKIISENGTLKIGTDFMKYGGSGIDHRIDNCRIHLKKSVLKTSGDVSIKPTVKIIGYNSLINIQHGSNINYGSEIICSKAIYIGRNCRIAPHVTIRDSDAHKHSYGDEKPKSEDKTVCIGNNVWIGQRAMILKGVSIKDGAVVAPCSVVTRDVASKTLVGGIPAKKIKDNINWCV